jgi:hypothetical protein
MKSNDDGQRIRAGRSEADGHGATMTRTVTNATDFRSELKHRKGFGASAARLVG